MEGEPLATCCGSDALMMRVVAFGATWTPGLCCGTSAKDGAEGWAHHLNGCLVRLTGAKRRPPGAMPGKVEDGAFVARRSRHGKPTWLAGIKPSESSADKVSDEQLTAAAEGAAETHPAGGLAVWEALAESSSAPALTVRQVQLVLPPLKPTMEEEAPLRDGHVLERELLRHDLLA